jgi:integrase
MALMTKRVPGKTTLANGHAYSRLVVYPSNWNTPSADIFEAWYIKYRYYSPEFPKGKQRMITGSVNVTDDLIDRQTRMKHLLDQELKMLHSLKHPVFNSNQDHDAVHKRKVVYPGYPIPNRYIPIEREDSFKDAVLKAIWKPNGCFKHQGDVQRNAIRVLKAADDLGFGSLPIHIVSRKYIKQIFQRMVEMDPLMTNHLYNRVRTHMVSVFKTIEDEEVNENNPIAGVQSKPLLRKQQDVLSIDEINRVLEHLKTVDYYFYRFTYVFYHTASRPIELCRLKYEDVTLEERVYKVEIRKKKTYVEKLKPIHKNTHDLWVEIMSEAKPGQYLFGIGFKPGSIAYMSNQYSTKFKSLVKDKLDIHKNFYTCKHRKLSEIQRFMSTQKGLELAKELTQRAAIHDSFNTTSLYLTEQDVLMNRILENIESRV